MLSKKKKNEMNFIFEIQKTNVMHKQMQHISNTAAAFQIRLELSLNTGCGSKDASPSGPDSSLWGLCICCGSLGHSRR